MINKRYIKDYSYPDYDDEDFLSKIYKKREFYYYKVPERPILKNYEDIKKYREEKCKGDIKEPTEQQSIIPNFISPNTLYKGILLMHGVGTGKTMTAIKIAEQFKDQIKKYNTKIVVLVPGPNTRKNIEKELLYSTNNEYLNMDLLKNMSKDEINKERKIALYNALQYYKIMSYKTFHKKVLGEKIIEKKIINDTKLKSSYKKNENGDYYREIAIDKISNLNNTIIIVDEAHNISGNEYGEALHKIIDASENIRVILLTATPMVNYADQIINLLNFITPKNNKIERDKIFTTEKKNYLIKIKPNGLEYLKSKARGLISYYRGSVPYTFAKRNDKGTIPKELLFTNVIRCPMSEFQNNTYLELTKSANVDTLTDIIVEKSTSFTSGIILLGNFVFPGLNKTKDNLVGFYTSENMNILLSQIASDGHKLCSLINKYIFNDKFNSIDEARLITARKKNISGLILRKENIKHFSSKFYAILNNIEQLVENKNGSATAFIYSNFVNVGGIELLAETLIENGYLEYQNDYNNYDIKDNTLDYKTGLTYYEFKKKNLSYFRPAAFLLITGGIDESFEEVSEIKQKYIQDVFNNSDNINGRNIKFILGSKVMNEGITLANVKEIHIMEPFFNISKIEQVIGRAIRVCVHMDVITDKYRYPEVDIYRYVISNNLSDTELSTDEILYKKAELKYLLVKDVERALKEIAIDCPLLLHANVFPEELEKYKNCVYPTLENKLAGKKICPALCDFRECTLKCDGKYLNDTLWDNNKYKNLNKNELDYNTYNQDLAKSEIELIKIKIKDLYKFKHLYLYDELLSIITKSYKINKAELFENKFLDIALEQLMPQTENDFNNFRDIIYDKYNRLGYVIQRGKYFIFQLFNESEQIPIYYRKNINIIETNLVSINNYVKQNYKDYFKNTEKVINITAIEKKYDFDNILDYYNSREENFIVGIVDKNYNKNVSNEDDIFKIRPPLIKNVDKKRGIGISSFKGNTCSTYKDKKYLFNLLIKLDPQYKTKNINKHDICNLLKKTLLDLEKYGTTKDKNKKTFMIIPFNHPIYIFPYNLEDRILYIINNINKKIGFKINYTVSKNNKSYEITIPNELKNNLSSCKELLDKYDFKIKNNNYTTIIS